MKIYKFISSLMCVLLVLMYLAFTFSVSCMFSFFPWYDAEGFYMLTMLFVWLPLSLITIIQIVISAVAKHFDKLNTILLCLNALYIPLIFVLGFTDASLNVFRTIGVVGIITMVAYVVNFIRRIKKI